MATAKTATSTATPDIAIAATMLVLRDGSEQSMRTTKLL